MKNTLRKVLFSLSLPFLLSACGGGGGESVVTPLPPTKAILKVSVSAVPFGILVGGVQATFTLPLGTFLATDIVTGEVSNDVVTLSGVANGSLSAPSYNPTTRLVSFGIVNAAGFGNGEILTINVSFTPDATIQASSFPTSATTSPFPLQIIDKNINPLTGVTCPITVTLQ